MIRSSTTLIVGAGASCEIELPDGRELLSRMAQGFDFARLGTQVQTRDMQTFAALFERLGPDLDASRQQLIEAGETLRTAARIGSSIDAILEQLGDDPGTLAVGKLAIVHYILQAESRSPLLPEPRDPGDLPLRGQENWLFQLGRMITSGVPRTRAEDCFDNLFIICFNYDRSIQHYLPYVLEMAFAMPLDEARQLVGARLSIVHPYGNAGRLPWEPGEGANVDWAVHEPENILDLSRGIVTFGERMQDRALVTGVRAAIAESSRLCFLGFGFDPMNMAFLFDKPLDRDPDMMATVTGLADQAREAVLRLLERRTGLARDGRISLSDTRCYQFMRDNALFLES